MKIGELSNRTGIATSAIRFYEESGLLPAAQRGPNGYRIYDEACLQRLLALQIARNLGFSLESLRSVLATADGISHELVLERMQKRLHEIGSLQAALRKQRKELLVLKEQLEQEWASGKCLTLAPETPRTLDDPNSRKAHRSRIAI